ncbi:hypothetical protein C0991_006626 [Blastosporella zonata]|nr:hypothetical protein C0991_006626 [Blastosporella zonata]
MSPSIPTPKWTPESWKEKPVAQPVSYPDATHLNKVLSKLESLPPLVTPSEIERLRHQLSLVQRNQAFVLHAGDCAESFDACTHENITAKIGLILSFSLILVWGARLPVVRIGRIAGQYAKPRSSSYERVGDREVLSFRREFSQIIDALGDALDFSRTVGADAGSAPYEQGGAHTTLGEVDFYTSHEGLMLDYEQALTRALPVPNTAASRPKTTASRAPSPAQHKAHYNTSAHFLWIGDRTRQLTGAHVEYFRGIRNPIGIKVGPSMQGAELIRLLDIVNPDREPGRVTLITRYGAGKINDNLPSHISSVQATGHPVVWICDPMHGNTQTSSSGLKTRHFGTIISELVDCLRIHAAHDSRLGGVSLEFTGELNDEGFSVTECVGGSMELGEEKLGLRYQVGSSSSFSLMNK